MDFLTVMNPRPGAGERPAPGSGMNRPALAAVLLIILAAGMAYGQARVSNKVKVPTGVPASDKEINFSATVSRVRAGSSEFVFSLVFQNAIGGPFDFICVPSILDNNGSKVGHTKKKMTRTGEVTSWSTTADGTESNKRPTYHLGNSVLSVGAGKTVSVWAAKHFTQNEFSPTKPKISLVMDILRKPSGTIGLPAENSDQVSYPKGNNSQKAQYAYSVNATKGKMSGTAAGGLVGSPLYLSPFASETLAVPAGNSLLMSQPVTHRILLRGATHNAPPHTVARIEVPDTVVLDTVRPSGDDTRNYPVCVASGDQLSPCVISDGAGGGIVVWQDFRSGNWDIYAQRVSADGSARWTADGVPVCTAANDQTVSTLLASGSAVPDGAGGAIIVWTDLRSGTAKVYAQRIGATGAVRWTSDGIALCGAANGQTTPSIVSDGSGGAVVVWTDTRNGTDQDICGQRVDSAGSLLWGPTGAVICSASGEQYNSSLTASADGGAVVVWTDLRNDPLTTDIYAQRVGANGSLHWGPGGVPLCTTADDQRVPSLVPDGSGGAIVTWRDHRSGNWDIYAQRVDSTGSTVWTAGGAAVCTAANDQVTNRIVSDGRGGAIIRWRDSRDIATGGDLYAGRIDPNGAPRWAMDGVVVCDAPNSQSATSGIEDGAGGEVIVWQDGRYGSDTHIFAGRIDPNGVRQWPEEGVPVSLASGSQSYPWIAESGPSAYMVVWSDTRNGGADIYAQGIAANGMLAPDSSYAKRGRFFPSDAYVDTSSFAIRYLVKDTASDPVVRISLQSPVDVPEGHEISVVAEMVADTAIVIDGDTAYVPGDVIGTSIWGFTKDTRPPRIVASSVTFPPGSTEFRLSTADDGTTTALAILEYFVSGDTAKVSLTMGPDSLFADSAVTRWKAVVGDSVTQYRYILADESGNRDTTAFIPAHDVLSVVRVRDRWNMVSVPVRPANGSKSFLFPGATSAAFAYKDGYLSRDTLKQGAGYWLKFPSADDIVISGAAVAVDTLVVYRGWNMIGSLTGPLPVSSIVPAGTQIGSWFYIYGSSGYESVDTIPPGKACWVKVSADGQLVRDGLFSARKRYASKDGLLGLCRLTITGSDGNAQVLYFGGEDGPLDASRWELPPQAPQGAFDARFATGRLVGPPWNGGPEEAALRISGAGYPLRVTWEMGDGRVRSALRVGRRILPMSGTGAVRVTEASEALTLQVLGEGENPREYSLGQNYPNPFNPATTIDYSLPVPSAVTVTVYNPLGQEVRRLVDGEVQAAGHRHVRFEAGDLSSGLYFYRLIAEPLAGGHGEPSGGSYAAAKKMILLK